MLCNILLMFLAARNLAKTFANKGSVKHREFAFASAEMIIASNDAATAF